MIVAPYRKYAEKGKGGTTNMVDSAGKLDIAICVGDMDPYLNIRRPRTAEVLNSLSY